MDGIKMQQCALCGYEYDASQLVCHPSCPLAERCSVICCPNCGYQVVDETQSATVKFVEKVWGRLVKRPSTPPEPAS